MLIQERITAYMRAINTFLTLKILANCQMSTGSLMTRQTYDRAPRLTKLATAHISRGDDVRVPEHNVA